MNANVGLIVGTGVESGLTVGIMAEAGLTVGEGGQLKHAEERFGIAR